jgi:hypothetical protein
MRVVPRLNSGEQEHAPMLNSPPNKIAYLSILATLELSDFNCLGERRHIFTWF